jgi:hypothetical protein
MTAKELMLSRLGKQKGSTEGAPQDVLREWLAALSQLYQEFAAWMNDAVAQNLLQVTETKIPIKEEKLGTYNAPALKVVTPRGDVMQILPRARMVVGAYGRVNFESSGNKAMLVRSGLDKWQFAKLNPDRGGWVFEDLTEESFWKTLDGLLS